MAKARGHGQQRPGALVALLFALTTPCVADTPSDSSPFGTFSLTDHTGAAVTERDFRGSWLLVFFGYTHCPDICPTTLATVTLALQRLDPPDGVLRPVFITVDPERDTPERLRAYLNAFDPRILGLTGTPEQVSAAARAFRAEFRPVRTGTAGDGYTVDHTGYVYLLAPDGELRTAFTTGDSAATLTRAMRRLGVAGNAPGP